MSSARKPDKAPTGSNFVEWVYETYRDQLHLGDLEGSRKYRAFLDSMDISTFPLSGATRVQSFHIIKFGYPMRRAGYVTAAFAVRVFAPGSTTRQHEAYYAYAYWPRQAGAKRVSEEPEYICLSPTFESRDGEYRHRFIWFKQFWEGYEANASLLSKVEERLLELIREDEIGIDLIFFPGDESGQKAVRNAAVTYADGARLGLKALVAIMATEAPQIRNQTMQRHSTPEYVAVMEILHSKCRDLFGEVSVSDPRFAVFVAGKAGQFTRTQCGQKLMPLTVRESIQVGDVHFAPWRETWVAQRATDLVVNGVAPMFPIYGNWAYLDGVDRSLFENRAMHHRYDQSLKAEGVAESLRQARVQAARAGADSDYRMGQLDAHIYESLEYAQDFVLLTDLAMCATSEYVGITMWSVPEIARRASHASPAYLRAYSEPAVQARYLFDLCYGAHALHSRLGVVHSDLHVNNMTLHELGNQYSSSIAEKNTVSYQPRFTNPVIAYALAGDEAGEAATYVFPHDGWFATLIDFSRAILGPEARPMIAAESGEAFAAGYYRDQASRALRALHFYVPAYVEKHQEKIKGLLYTNYDALFRVMTAIDFLAIGRNYGALLEDIADRAGKPAPEEVRVLEVAPEGIKMAAEIERLALEHLIVHLTDLVEAPKGRGGSLPPFAGNYIIPAVFDEYRYSAWAAGEAPAHVGFSLDKATLVDAYNGGAPLKYSGSDYERYPPWAKFDDLERHLGGLKIAQVTADRGTRPFLESRDLDGYLAVLQEQVRRDIDDKPLAATSSWIMD